MERLTSDRPVPGRLRHGVVALGNFDGFHRGHQAVVARAAERARASGRPLIVATFDPHPVRFFRPDAAPFRLTTLDQRERLFAAAGADAMLVFHFDAALAAVGPETFVDEWLAARAGAAAIVTGEDFTFARGRAGTVAVLADQAARLGIAAEAVAPVADDDGAVSSSRIRDALVAGDCAAATRLLTRPFAIEGIARSDGGAATLALGDYLRPAPGAYAVRGHPGDGRTVAGAAELAAAADRLELFFGDDADADALADRPIAVDLVAHLRPELGLRDAGARRAQIERDRADAARRLA